LQNNICGKVNNVVKLFTNIYNRLIVFTLAKNYKTQQSMGSWVNKQVG